MPRVSVIMPMGNVAHFVRAALSSILSQSFNDLEVIVVADGSSDASRAAVRACRDPRLRMVEGPGTGVASAFNAGLAAARGEIVMRCDADDLFLEGRVAQQVAWLDAHPDYGAICGGFSILSQSGERVRELPTEAEPADITDELLGARVRTTFCSFATRVEPLRAIRGCREYFETAEDIDLQLRLAEVCRVHYDPGCFYAYRLHDDSVTHVQGTRRREFFERAAREFRIQRSAGNPDPLERGERPAPPREASAVASSAEQVRGHLVGEAWRLHGEGRKMTALRIGVRALARRPTDRNLWRNVLALALKRSGTASPSA